MLRFGGMLILLLTLLHATAFASDADKVIDVSDIVIRELHDQLWFCEKSSVHSFNVCVQQEPEAGEPTQVIHSWWNAATYVTAHTNTVEPTITNVERLTENSLRIQYR